MRTRMLTISILFSAGCLGGMMGCSETKKAAVEPSQSGAAAQAPAPAPAGETHAKPVVFTSEKHAFSVEIPADPGKMESSNAGEEYFYTAKTKDRVFMVAARDFNIPKTNLFKPHEFLKIGVKAATMKAKAEIISEAEKNLGEFPGVMVRFKWNQAGNDFYTHMYSLLAGNTRFILQIITNDPKVLDSADAVRFFESFKCTVKPSDKPSK